MQPALTDWMEALAQRDDGIGAEARVWLNEPDEEVLRWYRVRVVLMRFEAGQVEAPEALAQIAHIHGLHLTLG